MLASRRVIPRADGSTPRGGGPAELDMAINGRQGERLDNLEGTLHERPPHRPTEHDEPRPGQCAGRYPILGLMHKST